MNRDEKRSIFAGLYGNALEWYDFLLFASFAPIFADYFFPAEVHLISLLVTFGVFAIGFIMRPIGGVLLGHYADYAGRRKALILSVSVMSIATTCIALLPNYYQAGWGAPLLFTFFRLVQGLAVGGELPGSTTFLIEHMFAHRRGLAGSLVLSTAFLGIFAGSITASALSAALSYKDLAEWGWRIAYIAGGLLGIFGIYLRIKSIESPAFKSIEKASELPAKLVFTRYGRAMGLSIILTSIMALGNYVLIAYMTTFLVKWQGFVLRDALFVNLNALFILIVLIPVMGYMSDFIGRKPVLLSGLVSLCVLIFPIFWMLLSGNWWLALGSEVLLSLILAPINATVPTIIAELFPTAVRASGTSIGYNIGQAVFGGTLPVVALALTEFSGSMLAPAWYVFICAVLVVLCTSRLQETYQRKL